MKTRSHVLPLALVFVIMGFGIVGCATYPYRDMGGEEYTDNTPIEIVDFTGAQHARPPLDRGGPPQHRGENPPHVGAVPSHPSVSGGGGGHASPPSHSGGPPSIPHNPRPAPSGGGHGGGGGGGGGAPKHK